jgi:hypothetical protein
MPPTDAADLAAGAVAMVGEARFTIEHQAVFTNTVVPMKMAQGEKSIYIPKFGTVVTEDLIDGVDMANSQALTITGTTHTTDEAGCKVIVTKKLKNHLKAPAFRAAGKVIGNSMQKSIDKAGLALYSGLDSGLSQANNSFTLGYLAAAVTQCIGQSEPSPIPLAVVAHPYLLHPLIDLLATPANTAPMAEAYQMAVLRNHFMGIDKLYGVPIFRDANATIDTSDDSYGAIYSKSAFIYITGYEIENWVVYDDSLRGWEIGIVHDYAMVEEDGTYGRYLLFDATAPTS